MPREIKPQKKKKEAAKKKPPRPYTEYNIFFQLERERILVDLLEKKEKKEAADARAADGDGDGEETKEEDTEKVADGGEGANDSVTKEEEEDDQTTETSKEVVELNRPSDPNDILPRPPRFAHLQLSPLWYDSTHRLAETKRNKSRRKHRKTHGLVGFLDLTRMIAAEWRAVPPETKAYCKKVADRQLKLYKEELKVIKKKQQSVMLMSVQQSENDDNNNEGEIDDMLAVHEKDQRTQMQMQQMLRVQNRTEQQQQQQDNGTAAKNNSNNGGDMMMNTLPRRLVTHDGSSGNINGNAPSYPPPPGYSNKYWQQQQQQQQQQYHTHQPHQPTAHQSAPSPQFQNQYPSSNQQHPSSAATRNNMMHQQHFMPPPMTPDGASIQQQHSPSQQLTPMEELMHRRALYGAQAGMIVRNTKERSPGTSRLERMRGSSRNNANAAGAIKKVGREEATSYLSPPSDSTTAGKQAAVTPSPSRRKNSITSSANDAANPSDESATAADTSSSAAVDTPTTPSAGPMKKRLKMSPSTDATENAAAATNKDTKKPEVLNSRLRSTSSSLFHLSPPGGMMTPGSNGFADYFVNGSPFGGSTGGIGNNFPYIDWNSPNDNSPQEQAGVPPPVNRNRSGSGAIPPHLAVPGSYHHGNGTGELGPSGHPTSQHYLGGPSNHPMMAGMSSPRPMDGIGFANEGELDLDEEEMQLLWHKLAANAKRKRIRDGNAAMNWMYSQSYGYGSFGPTGHSFAGGPTHSYINQGSFAAASPGGGGVGMMPPGAHSFSSPIERPDIVGRGASSGSQMMKKVKAEESTNTDAAEVPVNKGETAESAKVKKELPSLKEAV